MDLQHRILGSSGRARDQASGPANGDVLGIATVHTNQDPGLVDGSVWLLYCCEHLILELPKFSFIGRCKGVDDVPPVVIRKLVCCSDPAPTPGQIQKLDRLLF